ncbi:hypothetical protein [Mesorhizobium sp. M0058]|uniref:hypothetical protein n=1 Tax=Mesorhizobium sp. M0058 TaxID=2956865 RepID=UPI003337594A
MTSDTPAGYLFELCYSHANDRWSGTMFSEHLPYPESDIRNVRPLYLSPTPPKVGSGELDAAAKITKIIARTMAVAVGKNPDIEGDTYMVWARLAMESASPYLALAAPVDHPEVVKTLSWEKYPAEGSMTEGQNRRRNYVARALTPWGSAIFLMENDGVYSFAGWDALVGSYVDADDAKAFAQTHFNAAIRSALQPSDSPALEAGVAEAALQLVNAFSIYTLDDDEGIRLSTGGHTIAHYGEHSREGIALLKLEAHCRELRAALSIPAKESGK